MSIGSLKFLVVSFTLIVVFGIILLIRTSENTISLYGSRHRKLQQQQYIGLTPLDPELRIAVYGGANAYGAGFKKDRLEKAYPFLLIRNAEGDSGYVDNFAHSSMGPNQNSVCFDSTFDQHHYNNNPIRRRHLEQDTDDEHNDLVYDIILLDYWLFQHEGLEVLARRLRARFPYAAILFLKTNEGSPVNLRRHHKFSRNHGQGFLEWVKSIPGGMAHPLMSFREDFDSEYQWYLPLHKQADEAIEAIAKEVHGFDCTSSLFGNMKDKASITEYFTWYGDHTIGEVKKHGQTFLHLNEMGHRQIAGKLQSFIRNNIIRDQYRLTVSEFIQRNTKAATLLAHNRNTWKNGDDCHWWYFTGDGHPDPRIIRQSSNFHMKKISPHDNQYALELDLSYTMTTNRLDHEIRGDMGSIVISNPDLTHGRHLYLSYMTSPFPNPYPCTVALEIYATKGTTTTGTTVPFVKTFLDTHNYNNGTKHGLIRTISVWPHFPMNSEFRLEFTPVIRAPEISDIHHHPRALPTVPFRLVGYLFSETTKPLEYAFGPTGGKIPSSTSSYKN